MLIVKDRNMKELGILNRATKVGVELKTNEISTATFTLPLNDKKNELCTHFNYVDFYGKSGRFYGTFRIMPRSKRINDRTKVITYKCEHVFAALLSNIMFKYHQFTNYTTTEVLQAILDMQTVKRWELGIVEFERFFHYAFENEAGLLAPILSVPKPFNEPYEFTFDTSVYPWKLNLVKPSNVVQSEIREGKNLISFEELSDPTDVVNVIYPLGSGEGVNQLGIEDVNGGLPYLRDEESILEYGEQEYPWIDRRFDNPQSLKENAQALLDQWKFPKLSFPVKSADLTILNGEAKTLLNTVTRIIVNNKEYEARLIDERRPDILGEEHKVEYDVNSRLDDIATTQAEVERKIQVNQAYSQGATNILNVNAQDNADAIHPINLPFVVDDDVFNVNTVDLWFRTMEFRAYSQATEGGGATVQSTGSGGGALLTSAAGGGISTSTQSGGESVQSSSSNGTHRHKIMTYSQNDGTMPDAEDWKRYYAPRAADGTASGLIWIKGASGDIYTDEAAGNHSHSVPVPAHSHDFQLENHTHTVEIKPHVHNITLPNHIHSIAHGIYELSELPNNVTINVDGNTVDFDQTSGDRINLIDYIEKDSNGKITRGRHVVQILPDAKARIEAELIFRVFIKSHLGGTY